jgi:VWFA-related protein
MLTTFWGHAQQAPPAAAHPQSAGAQAPPATIRTQANLVLLDVVVTAKDEPAHGLAKGKFHVLDNGVPQQISVFEEHSPGDAPAPAKAPDLGPNTYSNLPQSAPGSAANVLLLDALNTPIADQNYARRQMIQYLKSIPPGTRIAVFTLASRLRMVVPFTADASLIASVLESKGAGAAQPSAILDSQFDQDVAGQSSNLAGFGPDPEALASFEQFQADSVAFATDLRVQMTLDAFRELARYLNVIPGRKNVIWFSGSFPLTIEPDPSQSDSFEAMRTYSDDVRLTDGMLSSARVAVYPVDARGLMTLPSQNASSAYQNSIVGPAGGGLGGSGSRRGSAGRATNPSAGMAAINADNAFQKQTMLEHAAMQQVAHETGGEAFADTNGIKEAVARAVANGSNYYTIGYVPSWKNYDGAFHRLKVTVDGQFNTAYRQGYFADDLAKAKVNPLAAQHLMNAALEQGAPPLSELLFKVRVQTMDRAPVTDAKAYGAVSATTVGTLKGPVHRYAVDFGVPAHLLAFPASADGLHHGRLEFVLVAYSADGKRLNSADQNADFNLKPELYNQVLQYGIPMHQEIDLPPGLVFLRIAVHDLTSDRVGAIEVPLNVAK